MASRGFLVVTDLDGTLLDHTYDLAAATQVMDGLSQEATDVIPASSKTLQELHQLNQLRAAPTPLIFENGAGIAYPTQSSEGGLPYRIQSNGLQYPELCELLDGLRDRFNFAFEGFHDLSDAGVAKRTGLSLTAANLAKQRLFSEPLRWQGTEQQQQEFRHHLQAENLQLVSGGRFLHVMPMTDKGMAARELASFYDVNRSNPRWKIACGDSDNDLPLFHWADAIVLFPNRHNQHLKLSHRRCLRAEAAGPNTWTRCVSTLIHTLNKQPMGSPYE